MNIKQYFKKMGSKGGKVKSAVKAKSSRENLEKARAARKNKQEWEAILIEGAKGEIK